MISYFKNEEYAFNTGEQAKGARLIEGACLSTDTKPTEGIANGSCLIEMDTGDKFMFDEANGEWLNITNPGGGGGAEVWFTGENPTVEPPQTIFDLVDVGGIDHTAELYNNGTNYTVYLNGEELTFYDAEGHGWANTDDPTAESRCVIVWEKEGVYTSVALYMNTTAPTSVEVSVAAK